MAIPEAAVRDAFEAACGPEVESRVAMFVAMAARALADAPGPHRDEGLTVATLLGMCGEVRRGVMPEATLQDAFEAGCGRAVGNRGAAFVAEVRKSIARAKGRGRPPAGRSGG